MPRKHVCHSNYPFPNTQNISTHGHTEIRLITFFVAKDEEAIYSLQKKKNNNTKKELELAVAWIMNFLLQNSGLN